MDRHKNKSIEAAKIGIEAEAFAEGNLNRLLEQMRAAEEKTLLEALVSADPSDIPLGTKIRNHLHVISMFRAYLGEIINMGRTATKQMEDDEAADQTENPQD